MTKVFIYVTLKTDQKRNFYLTRKNARLLGKAVTAPRYRLMRPLLADYHCLVEDAKKGVAVEGELWEVSAADERRAFSERDQMTVTGAPGAGSQRGRPLLRRNGWLKGRVDPCRSP